MNDEQVLTEAPEALQVGVDPEARARVNELHAGVETLMRNISADNLALDDKVEAAAEVLETWVSAVDYLHARLETLIEAHNSLVSTHDKTVRGALTRLDGITDDYYGFKQQVVAELEEHASWHGDIVAGGPRGELPFLARMDAAVSEMAQRFNEFRDATMQDWENLSQDVQELKTTDPQKVAAHFASEGRFADALADVWEQLGNITATLANLRDLQRSREYEEFADRVAPPARFGEPTIASPPGTERSRA